MIRSLRFRRSIWAVAAASLLAASAAQAGANYYRAGDENDPHLRAARFLGEDKRHLSAVAELLRIEQQANGKPAAVQFRWLLADNYVSFGQRERADQIYDAIGPSADPLQFTRAQFKLAQFEYTRGYLPEARERLRRIQSGLPKELLAEWQDLLSKVLLAQGRNAEAIDILTAPKNGDDQTVYTRYNLGIALIREGRKDQGRTVLDRIGDQSPETREDLALADKANLTLGWNFLQDQQAAAARPVLRRIRVQGPFSNRALLGLGWAELIPDGNRAKHAAIEDGSQSNDPYVSFSTLGVLLRRGQINNEASERRGFYHISGSSDQEIAMNRALESWLLLIDRDPQDPAVQEGWLAIPYALDQLGAHEQAGKFYEQAIVRLEGARQRTAKAITALRSNRMIDTIIRREADAESGWNWELKDLPDAPETYYLQTILAEHRFAEALKNYRDARLMQRNLEAWEKRLDDADTAYASLSRPAMDTKVLFDRARENRTPTRVQVSVKLALAPALAAPGFYDQPIGKITGAGPALKLADAPAPTQFKGTYENIAALRTRLASLKPALARMGDEQGKLLSDMANAELAAQKTLIERYLVEARFALARLYDRPQTTSDPDEFEIKK